MSHLGDIFGDVGFIISVGMIVVMVWFEIDTRRR